MNYPYAFMQFLFLGLADLIFDFLGLFVVAIAISFRKPGTSVQDGRPITNLPKWAYPWGNDFDGLLGDSQGWWAANTPFGLPPDSFLSMYVWAAIRNPANNTRMFSIFNAPIQGSQIEYKGDFFVGDHPGESGFQFVKLTHEGIWPRYGLYWVRQWTSKHASVIRLGFKISPDQIYTNELPKGSTFRINPWKRIAS